MGYLVLSRKYRPQSFEEVVKQDHVTRTLRNAITSGRLAHAILFSGPRGTGKTTIARILAKCVNCASGPTPIPCNTCRSCKEITSGHAADVFEIDGASNNKVENIRELRENAAYMPAHSPFKIYIIDEVHMLSDSAFNALLKIIEEPPPHVMFFFATTEPNKIPITILSRCQRHDLRRIDINAIIDHLEGLCQKEKIDINKEGLTIISREADGSIRDALSLLDHVISSNTGSISTESILDIIGGIDRQVLFEISNAVFHKDIVAIIEIIDRLYERGQHMMRCFIEIIDHFRNLLLIKMGGSQTTLSDVPQHEIDAMRHQLSDVSLTYLNQVMDMLFKEEKNIKLSVQPKLALEMAFIRILQIQPALSLDTLIEKMDLLQKGIVDTLATDIGDTKRQSRQFDQSVSGMVDPVSQGNSLQNQKSDSEDASSGGNNTQAQASLNPREDDISDVVSNDSTKSTEDEEPIENSWGKILEILSRGYPSIAACFAESKASKKSADQIAIEFAANQFNINYALREDNRLLLKKAWSDYFGRDIQVFLVDKLTSTGNAKEKKREKKQLQDEAINHPLVAKAVKLFNGKIVDIKII